MKTPLGKKLVAIRQRAIKNGMQLLSEEELLNSGHTEVLTTCQSCLTAHLAQPGYNDLKLNTITGQSCGYFAGS